MLTEEQIEIRRDGIGGSDAPIVCGMSRRMTARELYHLKRDEVDEPKNPDDELAWLGNEIEPVIARAFVKDARLNVARVNSTLYHPDLPWMLAHIDRRVKVRKPRAGLELKYRVHADQWGAAGTDQVPDDVLLQCEHYLGVTGWDVWYVTAFLGGREFRTYEIPKDQTLIDRLIAKEQDFMRRLEEGDPPPLDHEHPTTRELLQRLYPGTDGRQVALGEDLKHWHEVREQASAMMNRYRRAYDAATAHIEEVMGTASIGIFGDGSGYVRKMVRKREHTVAATSYIQTRYQPPPQEYSS